MINFGTKLIRRPNGLSTVISPTTIHNYVDSPSIISNLPDRKKGTLFPKKGNFGRKKRETEVKKGDLGCKTQKG